MRDGCSADNLLREAGARVTGVAAGRNGERIEIPADLTVDCTGRGSRAPRLLAEMGFIVRRKAW